MTQPPLQSPPALRPLRAHLLLAALCTGGALLLLLMFLRRNGFWIDELYTLHSIRLGWREMVLERLNRGHFPGYFALVRLWYSLWDPYQFELALRSLSALFYVLAVGSFWFLARRILTLPAALIALSLFACNNIALRQASEARMYTVVLFIAVWIIRAWYEVQQPGSRRGWAVALPILTALGFAVSATVGVLIATMLIVSFARPASRKLRATLSIALIAGLAVFIPGAILHVETAVRIGVSASKPLVFLAHPVALMPGIQIWDDYYKSDWRSTALLILGIPITLYAILTLWKHRAALTPELRRTAIIVASPIVLIVLCYPLVELFKLDIMGPPRYFITLLPMASILGGWCLARLPRPALVHGVLTLFLLASAYTILTVKVERFRDVVLEDFAPHYHPGDGLIVTANEIADGVELYARGSHVDAAVSRWEMDKDNLRQQIAPLSDHPTVWVVWYRGADSPLLDVASELWGPFTSNKPGKKMGSLRVLQFHPPQK